MQRISLPWIMTTATKLEVVTSIVPGQKLMEVSYPLFEIFQMVDSLFEQSIYKEQLRISREAAYALRSAVNEMISKDAFNPDRVINEFEAWNLKAKRDAFRTVLLAELNALPAFLVTGKEPYEIDRLIANGSSLFPADLLQKVPESALDASEVGKCLAYELSTACGFHTFRIVEAVVRRYWDANAGARKRPHPETIGNIAGQMELQKIGDEKVREALKQLAKLHRNPLAHHEVVLTLEEAVGTIGMARSVITSMLQYIPDFRPTTLVSEASLASLFVPLFHQVEG